MSNDLHFFWGQLADSFVAPVRILMGLSLRSYCLQHVVCCAGHSYCKPGNIGMHISDDTSDKLPFWHLQIKAMEEDPYNNLGNLRARTANEILKAFSHVSRNESALHLPIYAHHGTRDRLADIEVGSLRPGLQLQSLRTLNRSSPRRLSVLNILSIALPFTDSRNCFTVF